jgi:hypothetical protein
VPRAFSFSRRLSLFRLCECDRSLGCSAVLLARARPGRWDGTVDLSGRGAQRPSAPQPDRGPPLLKGARQDHRQLLRGSSGEGPGESEDVESRSSNRYPRASLSVLRDASRCGASLFLCSSFCSSCPPLLRRLTLGDPATGWAGLLGSDVSSS